LARTARLAAVDNAALDRLAMRALDRAATENGGLAVASLAALPTAIRTRVLHRWAGTLGAPGASLSHRHVEALDALVTEWHGQGAVSLPGGATVVRRNGCLARGDTGHMPGAPRSSPVDEAGLAHG
jgi:tRNA(Ile)-lysidine synthase